MKFIDEIKVGGESKIILRLDLEVPVKEGKVIDNTRLLRSIETLNILKESGASVAIVGHKGRRKPGEKLDKYSLKPICEELSNLIGFTINFVENPKQLFDEKWTMMENTRFWAEEGGADQEKDEFANEILNNADIVVFDAFASAYRDVASVTTLIKNANEVVFGINFKSEFNRITEFLNSDDLPSPVTLILGGVKIRNKIGIIKKFLDKADYFVFGGALANTLLKSEGFEIGKSLHDEGDFELAQNIMLDIDSHGKKVVLPTDVVACDEINDKATTVDIELEDLDYVMSIGDIGKITLMKYAKIIRDSKTVIFNGPMGAYEAGKQFEKGTKTVLEYLETEAKRGDKVLIGGGDTLKCLHEYKISHDSFYFVSTGGKSMVNLLAGEKLEAIKAYEERS